MILSPTQHQILRVLIEHEKVSMKGIAKELSINPSTVSRNFRPLIESGFVVKTEELAPGSQGGRKTSLFSVNPSKFFVGGIGIEQNRLMGVVIDVRGNPVHTFEKHEDLTGSNFLPALLETMKTILRKYRSIIGISIGMPGIIQNGEVIVSSAIKIENLELANLIEKSIGLKSIVLNDANAAVVGSSYRRKNVVYFLLSVPYYLNLPVGIGAGLWLEDRLYEGSKGAAGEFEEHTLPPILDEPLNIDETNLKLLPFKVFSELLEKLISISSFVAYLFDPEALVFGGDIVLFPDIFVKELEKEIRKRLQKRRISETEILFDEKGLWTTAFGAARAFWKKIVRDYEFAQEVIRLVKE
ncbi:ROK family transcriptional regulator [Thermotoga sp. KOL6]|uniref:ROK family transcriptional regulator n=1 Tax=Thermotoga sp. KOL6 TaxID=126741 RepID=UPI000C77C253|nr:ROK family transcriptional regulator [Thermotoga sp. KOL6]PLV58295.1 ArsR family transcriptional regulator [Thermotoga sp. KOL6]